MFRIYLIGLGLFFSSPSFAVESLPYERFERWLDILEETLESSRSASRVAEGLVRGPERVAAFNLQALGRIYRDEARGFKDLRSDFKKMEDAIGAYKKWQDIIDANDGRVSRRVRRSLDAARDDLVEMLRDDDWVGRRGSRRLREHREFLRSYDFGSYEHDKAVALDGLIAQLAKVDERDYDLSLLEEGNGLHELRREIRWFTLEARALGGLLTFREDDSDCSSDRYRPLLGDEELRSSRYGELPLNPEEGNACKLSRCLFLGVTELVMELGDLKDRVESETQGRGDEVPPHIQEQAEALYSDMLENDLIDQIRSQLYQCQD